MRLFPVWWRYIAVSKVQMTKKTILVIPEASRADKTILEINPPTTTLTRIIIAADWVTGPSSDFFILFFMLFSSRFMLA